MDTEKRSFRLLDQYARNKHGCFITEFFLDLDGAKYVVCFRPLKISKEPANRYARRYLRFPAHEIHLMNGGKPLSPDIADEIDAALSTLPTE